MFLREKKVGGASYLQLVQSKRTNAGPRGKVVASLGRKDVLQESGQLDLIAAAFSRMGAQGIFVNAQSRISLKRTSLPAFQKLILGRALRLADLTGHYKRLLRLAPDGSAGFDFALEQLAKLVFASPSRRPSPVNIGAFRFPKDMPEAVATLLTRGNTEDSNLIVHIEKAMPVSPEPAFTRGLVTATALNSRGNPLMVTHWLEHQPLINMILQNVERILYAMPGRRLVISLDTSLVRADRIMVRKKLLSTFDSSDVRFVTPLRESSARLQSMPEEILEQRLDNPPFADVGEFRYVRATDKAAALREQQVREFILARLHAQPPAGEVEMKARAAALEQFEAMALWEGNTLLVSNMKGSPREICTAHVTGQKGHLFQRTFHDHCAALMNEPDLPRDGAKVITDLFCLQLLANQARLSIMDRINRHASSCLDWEEIEDGLESSRPLVVSEENTHVALTNMDTPFMQALSKAFDLTSQDISELEVTEEGRQSGPVSSSQSTENAEND